MKYFKIRTLSTSLIAVIFLFFVTVAFASADVLGDKKTFFTNTSYDQSGRSSVPTTLRTVSDHAYFYTDDKYWSSLSSYGVNVITNAMKDLASEFDNKIYPTETKFWGSEPNPGIDGDLRLTILLEDLTTGSGGYFETVNLAPKSQATESNEREMIAANIEAVGSPFLKAFLGHEFQHLISYNQKEIINKSTEDVWLNELRSEYSITLDGYNDYYTGSSLERRVKDFLENSSDSLTEWPNVKTDYAIVVVFGEYLTDRFGPEILSQTLRSKSYGIPSLEEYLNARGASFADVFMDWMAASYLNNRSLDPRFGYSKGGLNNIKVTPQSSIYFSSSSGDYNNGLFVKDWQPYWIEYNLQSISDRTKSVVLDINGQAGQNFLVSYSAFYNNGQIKGGKIPLLNGKATGYIPNSQDMPLNKVILMLTNGQKLIDFSKSEPSSNINIRATMTDNAVIETQTLKDGVLIKRPGEKEIYVIWGKYKRYLNSDVIKLYGHLDPSKAIAVGPEVFDSYQTSNYVKYVNDEKVYAIWPPDEGSRGGTSTGIVSDGTKHWLHITPQQWDASARDWNAIFVINDLELNVYKIGPDIIR